MWIVRIALLKPYTFIVMAILILILGILSIVRTPTDIFPNIDIPVVSVLWSYAGLPPDELDHYITNYFERAVTTTVNDIEHIESNSLNGIAVVKIFFQPNVNIDMAISQVTAISQTMLRNFPPGTLPPQILSYSASTVSVIQLVLSSTKLSEQELNDLGNNFIRTQLATVEGAALPYPYGGKVRQIQVDLDPAAMQTYGITAADVNSAIANQNLIIPAGTEKIGQYEYFVKLNGSPITVEELNDLPIRKADGTILYVRDIGHVRDGFPPQTNIVRVDGARAVLMGVQKTGSASTLEIINSVKERIPKIKEIMPASLDLKMVADQSIFILAAIKGVITEGAIAAVLTGLMILLFLGSWRSTLIITISIPLSILASIIVFSALGQTINIMTLGGLALAVGILVDDATVTIENINWNLEQKKDIHTAILDGASQIALPALVSTLSICIVFVPMFFLEGVAHFLFVPLAEAVVFSILASYLLSRTLVPTMAQYLLKDHNHDGHENKRPSKLAMVNSLKQLQVKFENHFTKLRTNYRNMLEKTLQNYQPFICWFLFFLVVSGVLMAPWIGSDFFPTVDAGQIKMHVRAPTGTRVEETARLCDEIDQVIRRVIPADELDNIVDNIGLPISGINLSYSNSGVIGPEDADISIALKDGHRPSADYIRILRDELVREFPGVSFSFLPADIVGQILNFGLPAPINVQVSGTNVDANREYAAKLLRKMRHISGIVDVRIHQAYNYPTLQVNVDRSYAKEVGFTQSDVANNLLIALSGTFQIAPTFWLDHKNGISYPLVTQVPQYRMDTLQELRNIPLAITPDNLQILGGLADIKLEFSPAVESNYNALPVIDIYAAVQDRDLGGVASDLEKIIAEMAPEVPKGSFVTTRGQIETQASSFKGLFLGLLFAIVLVYLLIVVNFQSWLDPFIIITALPAAIVGIIWMLFFTHTHVSVPALTGAIMCMGVATANSILVVSFAKSQMAQGANVLTATLEAGFVRIRPVLMTALAMIIGMLPMSLGLGDGGEQNAPLGRAVIGGLLFATFATLFFVPAVFYLIHGRKERESV